MCSYNTKIPVRHFKESNHAFGMDFFQEYYLTVSLSQRLDSKDIL